MSQELAAGLTMSMAKIVRRLKALDAGARLSQPCASALAVIVVAGRARPGDVARNERVTPASITPVLKELVEKGLITRSVNPIDRRAAWLTPTAKGKRWFEEGHIRATKPLADALGSIDPKQRETLAAALGVLRRIETALHDRASEA
jgi:DNA-binding MarR family transcriptional regulator